jgi:hypothetical protein
MQARNKSDAVLRTKDVDAPANKHEDAGATLFAFDERVKYGLDKLLEWGDSSLARHFCVGSRDCNDHPQLLFRFDDDRIMYEGRIDPRSCA